MFVQGSGAAHAAAATHDRPNTSMDDTGTPAADHVDADGGFTKHKATIARLYLAEGRTLDDVRDIMTKTHHFTASTKMYKSRFKKWGWRKNIRFDQPLVLHNDSRFLLPIQLSDSGSAPTFSAATAAAAAETIGTTDPTTHLVQSSQRQRQRAVLEVQHKRLESYLRRRQHRDRARLIKHGPACQPQSPVAMKSPDRFWACQIVLIHVQQHIIRRYTGNLATTDALNDMWAESVEATLFSWDRYTYAVAEALETPGHFEDALVLLRRAPHELAMMLRSQPIITTSDLCVFIVYLTRPRANEDAQQKRQFYQVLRSLFQVAATPALFHWPPEHPMLRIFQGLVRTDDEDLHQLAREAWKLSASTMDLFLDNLGPSGAPALTSAGPGSSSSSSSSKSRAPPELICLLDETQRRARAGYGVSKPWLLESLYEWPEDWEINPKTKQLERTGPTGTTSPYTNATTIITTATNNNNDEPSPPKTSSLEQSVDDMVTKILKAFIGYLPHGGGKIVSMKAFFDAHSAYGQHDPMQRLLAETYLRRCIVSVCDEFGPHDPLVPRYLGELEHALRTWGETAKADGVVRWRRDLLPLEGSGDDGSGANDGGVKEEGEGEDNTNSLQELEALVSPPYFRQTGPSRLSVPYLSRPNESAYTSCPGGRGP